MRVDNDSERAQRELAAILGVIALQVEAALHETNAPSTTLVQATCAISKTVLTLRRCIFDHSNSLVRIYQEILLLHNELQNESRKAIEALQFHDRLSQHLTHVKCSLNYLSEFLLARYGTRSPKELDELQSQIRRIFSMDQERKIFDGLIPNDSIKDGTLPNSARLQFEQF